MDKNKAYTTINHNDDGFPPRELSMQAKHALEKDKTCLSLIKKNLLVFLLMISMFLGVSLGIILKSVGPSLTFRQIMYLRFPGEIFMNMLQLMILPLITSSLISGLTSLDPRASGKLGARAILYYLTTTVIAAIQGIVMVLSIRPGERNSKPSSTDFNVKKLELADTLLDLLRQMFPNNLVEACFTKRLTHLVKYERNLTETELNQTKFENMTVVTEYRPELEYSHGINMLGLVVISMALGIAINKLGSKGKPLKDVIEALCEATLLIVTAIIWFSPIGVFSLTAAQIAKMDDPKTMFASVGLYFTTVTVTLAFHGFLVLPFLYFLLVRENPYKFMAGMLQALLTAMGTASSSATLPLTMRNLEENNHIDPRVTSFVAPVGATMNMDGAAIYEAVAAIFIGQAYGFEMGIGRVIVVCFTATVASIGAAGVPQSGLVTMVLVLTAVGFPTEGIGMILAVDWLLDRFRTPVNVLGDAFGAGIVQHLSRADLAQMTLEDQMKEERQENMELAQVICESGSARQ